MPTTKDFEDILAGIAGNICSALPTAEDRLAYREWLQIRREALRAPPTTPANFTSLVNTANLIDQTFRTKLTRSTMENPMLTVPIGSDANYLYRLAVYPYHLIPHDQNCSYRSLDGTEELMDCSILGVNLTIQPREPAPSADRVHRSERLALRRLISSDDDHAPGFVFFQLGSLQYMWRNDEDGGSPGSAKEGAANMGDDDDVEDDVEWLDTNFYLVARLGQFGRSTGIYAKYNMFQVYGSSSHRRRIVHNQWGFLPSAKYNCGYTKQFSMARIGDALGSLGYGNELVLEEVIEHPVEIVRVKPAGNTLGAVRQTVDEAVTFDGRSW